jgi:carbon monoxide dehydrogenase subunit G
VKFEQTFTVPVSLQTTWSALTDIRRVVECLPGAAVDSIDGSHFTGHIRLKVGPIQVAYRGDADIVEQDEAIRRLIFEARGKETKGAGTAYARVSAQLIGRRDDETAVEVSTTFEVTGKPAQFGSSVIQAVGARVLTNFAQNLSSELTTADAARFPGGDRASTPGSGAHEDRPGAAELDLWQVLVPPWVRQRADTGTAVALGVLAAWFVTAVERTIRSSALARDRCADA